jgi:transcriptional repressor NrdR
MRCPVCHNLENRVLESRSADSGQSVRRRRECLKCVHRFTTYERIELLPMTVIKRSGQREIFEREKVFQGILRACEKTIVTQLEIEAVVNQIESDLQKNVVREVSSAEIGTAVLLRLKPLNEVAYIRFASVYSQFQTIEDFVTVLEQIRATLPNTGSSGESSVGMIADQANGSMPNSDQSNVSRLSQVS